MRIGKSLFYTATFLALTACGGDSGSNNGGGSSAPNASAELQRVTALVNASAKLPLEGESKTIATHRTVKVGADFCAYDETATFTVSRVTGDGFDETTDRAFTRRAGSAATCPEAPSGVDLHAVKTWTANDFMSSHRNTLQRLFDTSVDSQKRPGLQSVTLAASRSSQVQLGSGQTVNTHLVKMVETWARVGTVERTVEFSTDYWFLATVKDSVSLRGGPAATNYQVTSFRP